MKSFRRILTAALVIMALAAVFTVSAAAANIAWGAATVDATSLNIRSGPSTDYAPITAIISGTRIVILDKGDGKWFHINYQGTVGYVDSEYLKEVVTRENFKATGTLTATDVRLRAKPNTESDVLGIYKTNSTAGDEITVDVIGINDGWFKVKYDGKTGYIRSDLMAVTGAPSDYESTDAEGNNYSTSLGQQIANYALQYLGYDYVYGGNKPSTGFDCSGLSSYVYKQFGYDIHRRASEQYKYDGSSVSKDDLQQGDLVFFSSNGGSSVTHVGIYIGDGQFVHASTSKTGVIISDLSSSYYTGAWYGAKRII